MTTPRRTRLVRVPDLHAFRRAISVLWSTYAGAGPSRTLVIVPTQGAADLLVRTLERAGCPLTDAGRANVVTREQLYDRLHARLRQAPRRLTLFEREAIAQAAAREGSTDTSADPSMSAEQGNGGDSADDESGSARPPLPFRLRPGLVAEMLRFYDQLRRQSQQVERFAELVEQTAGSASGDVGAERILQQTRFLARTFQAYQRRVAEAGAYDEHALRERLIEDPVSPPIGHVISTVADWIADPGGLFAADFDLLARLPGLDTIDIVCTEALLGSGFHGRLHDWWPELEEASGSDIGGDLPAIRPVLVAPAGSDADRPWFTLRDREEELWSVVDRIEPEGGAVLERCAVVYKRPLPYLYLAPETLGRAGIRYQTSDALPLAAEPTAAALDLVLDFAETSFSRDALVALLRSPHYRFVSATGTLTREEISALDSGLSDARYLGDLGRLEELASTWTVAGARPALQLAIDAARELVPLLAPAPASRQIRRLLEFIGAHGRVLEPADPFEPRERRARAAVTGILEGLALAREAHHDEAWTIAELASAVRRWIQDETFDPRPTAEGVHLIDDQAARYVDLDDLALVGLIEHEWPERPSRNIFYAPGLLKGLGWPTERDRRAAADARFLDLLASASRRVSVSTITLDDETLVMRSGQLEEIPRTRLSIVLEGADDRKGSVDEGRSDLSTPGDPSGGLARGWADIRLDRRPAASAEFHGSIGRQTPRPWSVSALETYLGCPFKFFAQHLLRLDEEPDDEEIMDPRRQGRLLHQVFEAFFAEWQKAGRGAITPANLDAARKMFTETVDRVLWQVPEAEAALERTRLLGSSAAAGLGEAVLRMEAERPLAVVERLLEHRLEGTFSIATATGCRATALRGKADRLDLLEDGTFRLIDYKLGWPPDRTRALQLPIYGICAEQQLGADRGRPWRLGEAAYLAFKGPKRVTPLFVSGGQRDEVLAKAQQRLADTLDAIERGDFPPTPDDVYRCETCSFGSVCRKDYVGDV